MSNVFAEKLNRKIKALFGNLKVIPEDCREFGGAVAYARYARSLGLYPTEKYLDLINAWMGKELSGFTEEFMQGKYQPVRPKKKLDHIPVWICWLQGYDSMPEWCRCCYHNLEAQLEDGMRIEFLTFDNLAEYVDLPEFVYEKNRNKLMTNVALTDILRHALLSAYGGVWIDSAIFVTGKPFAEMLNFPFYSVKFYDGTEKKIEDASYGMWINGFMCSKGLSTLSTYCYHALLYLWSRRNRIVDYLQLDYIIMNAYTHVPEIRKLIDDVPVNNREIRLLNSKFNEPYTEELFADITGKNHIHLVNRHVEYLKLTGQVETLYGHLVRVNS